MSDQGYTPTTELVYGCFTPVAWQEQMFTEVKVAYRLIELCGPPDADAVPYDAEFTAAVDSEYDRWLAEVRREAAEAAWDEGEQAGMHNDRLMADGSEDGFVENPYRKVVSA